MSSYRKHRLALTSALILLSGSSAAGAAWPAPRSSAQSGAQSGDGVRIRLARFWRGAGQTLVEGVIGVPVRHVAGAANTLQVELIVRDSTGAVLHRENWTDTVSERLLAVARARGTAEATRMVSFAVRPGRYNVAATVTRGAQRDSAQTVLQGFAAAPLISDPLVSSRIRSIGEHDQPGAAELKKGRLAIETGTRTTVVATEPSLWYYLELYPVGSAAVNEQLEFSVSRVSGGAPLVQTQRPIAVNERGGVDAARLPLQGLPPGDYVLNITAKVGERSEQRTAAFTMGALQDAPVVVTPGSTASESALLEKYFSPAARSDESIGQIVEALVLASPAEPVPQSTNQMPADAKRRFLARFWSRVPDPKPATPQHELIEEYLGRVDFVSREYIERDIGRSGARTDRGRIYMKYGPPDAKQLLPMTGSRGVEVWKYTRNRGLKFAFLDETGFSNFKLVYTTDPSEQSLADWTDRVRDVETIRVILTF